jgi:small conductance mechanosensitive channel
MDVSIVSTKILTVDNRVVILPNGKLSNDTIDNYSAQTLRRVDLEVNVRYGVDADACVAEIQRMLAADERILTSKDERPPVRGQGAINTNGMPIPDPFVALLRLNESNITFVVRAWVLTENYWPVYFDLQKRFYTELPKLGFGFAYPHRDITILNEKP